MFNIIQGKSFFFFLLSSGFKAIVIFLHLFDILCTLLLLQTSLNARFEKTFWSQNYELVFGNFTIVGIQATLIYASTIFVEVKR